MTGLLVLGLCACVGDPPAAPDGHVREPPESGPALEELIGNDTPLPPAPELGDYDGLLNPAVLQEVRLTLDPAAIAALDADGGTFVEAGFEHDGNALRVGVHLKGSSTYQDFTGKPAFRIKFDEVVPNQAYAGLERLALNNLTGDPAQGREVVSYLAWAAGGMPVPRAALARVYVNGEYFGLYALVEAVDKRWAERRFGAPTGDLWAANDDADLTPAGVPMFDLVSGSGGGPVTPTEAAEALAAWSSDFTAQVGTVANVDEYLRFVAWSVATGGHDGYPWHLNDYFLYADPADGGRLVFAPWGQDEAWSDTWVFDYGGGILGWKCEADPACVAALNARIGEALPLLESADFGAVAEALFSLTRDAVNEDTRSPYTPEEVHAARELLADRIHNWPDTVRLAVGL